MIGARLGISSDPVWWVAPPWFWDVVTLLMLFASVLLAGSLRGNPAAVNPKGRIDLPDRPHGVYAITRHPMMWARSEEHTSELQSLMRISYAVFCLTKKLIITQP